MTRSGSVTMAIITILLGLRSLAPAAAAAPPVCDGVSAASETPLEAVRVAGGACQNDTAIACTSDVTCRFCVNNHTIPCIASSQCQAVGGSCIASPPPGTCAGTLVKPLYVTAPPGDTHRVLILEQDGRIRVLKDGVLLTAPFLDIDSITQSTSDEEGLLGLAFSPTYPTDGYFFIYYTENGGTPNTVARYQVSTDPNQADPASAVKVLSIAHPTNSNHNGGCLQFGPQDGYLYLAPGDGGNACDPPGNAQNTGEMKGKLLRIDVIPPPPSPPPAVQYRIPPTNPYVGPGNPLDEIMSIGLRNPWRFSFDRANSDLYIGDVGQFTWEEIDYRPHASIGGENYGWDHYEGFACPAPTCDGACTPIATRVDPVKVYNSGSGGGSNCSVTGGYVYRGCRMPGLAGRYFYGDYCAATISSFVISGGAVTSEKNHTAELAPIGGSVINFITSFGEDAQGEIYFTDRGTGGASGEVFKIVPALRNLEVSGSGATQFRLGATWTWENLTLTSSHPINFYRVYRNDGNGSGIFTCVHKSTTNSWSGGDPAVPAPGQVLSYVVTAFRTGPPSEETSPGRRSNGTPRTLSAAACP